MSKKNDIGENGIALFLGMLIGNLFDEIIYPVQDRDILDTPPNTEDYYSDDLSLEEIDCMNLFESDF